MSYRLSLLDKSPLADGEAASTALTRTVALARRAEENGFHRIWIAEHHANPLLASPAPEILIAHILAVTTRIRVGAGGVMLQHYSAFKVAETFNVLASLAPGRVDLGVGKAPGGFPIATHALQWGRDPAVPPDFAEQLAQLDGFLDGSLPADHPLAGAVATPVPPVPPDRFLLGASPESAELAAGRGWDFVYAGHFNGDPANIERSFDAYARRGGRRPLLALAAVVADRQEEAERLAGDLRIYRLHLGGGRAVNVGSVAQAAEFARQAGVADYRVEEKRPSVLAGTPDHVRRELDALHRRYGVEEFIVDIPVAGEAERFATVDLLAAAHRRVAA